MSKDPDVDLTEDKLFFLSEHIVYKSVCAPAGWSGEKVEQTIYDSGSRPGTSGNRWVVTSKDSLPECMPANPAPCQDCDGRQHWLLNC